MAAAAADAPAADTQQQQQQQTAAAASPVNGDIWELQHITLQHVRQYVLAGSDPQQPMLVRGGVLRLTHEWHHACTHSVNVMMTRSCKARSGMHLAVNSLT